MIIKGGAGGKGGHAGALATHLMRMDENTHVDILEHDPMAPADNLKAILSEFQMLARTNTRGDKGFYHASINPQHDDRALTKEEWKEAADILEKEMDFEGQPRVIVLHEKEDAQHIHIIWQRYDVETGKLRDFKNNYAKHMDAAREIENTLDLSKFKDLTQEQSFGYADTQQSARTHLSVKERQKIVSDIFEAAPSGRAFSQEIKKAGFELAQGDKPNTFVLIDQNNEVFSLVRQIIGHRKAAVHQKLAPLAPDQFMTVTQIRENAGGNREPEYSEIDRLKIDDIKQFYVREHMHLVNRQRAEKKSMEDKFHKQNTPKTRGTHNMHHRPDKKTLRIWETETERRAYQKIAKERLEKKHRNEKHALNTKERQDLKDFELTHLASLAPKYAKSQEDRLLLETRAALKELNLDDNSPHSIVRDIRRGIEQSKIQQTKDLYRTTEFLNKQEHCKVVFGTLFKNGQEAYYAFREKAREKGLKKAINDLVHRPKWYGEITNALADGQIDELAPILSQIHYTEKDILPVRARTEKVSAKTALKEHGEVDKPAQKTFANVRTWDEAIGRLETQLDKALEDPDDFRLRLMAKVALAADRLDSDTAQNLTKAERKEIQHIKEIIKKPDNKTRLETNYRSQTKRGLNRRIGHYYPPDHPR